MGRNNTSQHQDPNTLECLLFSALRGEVGSHEPEFRTFVHNEDDESGTAKTLEESIDVATTIWSSTGAKGRFHDVPFGSFITFSLWRLRIALTVTVTVGAFWWSDGGLRTPTAIATAIFASISTVIFVVEELGLSLILRVEGAASSVSAPNRGSQERLFR